MLNQSPEIKSALINKSQAAAYLNKTERWIQRYKVLGIPFHKIGRSVMFLPADLDNYIKRNRLGGELR